ncbi:MAG: SAM-dependent methyltransferase [Dysgonomonas sp.]|nr:SAM-dependent methyltransferase [Dysgonomonas sp.]
MILDKKIKEFIAKHESDNVHTLALQAKLYPEIDIQFAIQQITGRRIAKTKIPCWYSNDSLIYPKHLSLEQASSEQTALYKASIYRGNTMVDLTGGMGVDFSFIAPHFNKAIYVEQQIELTEIAKHNFDILSLNNVIVKNDDAVKYLSEMAPVNLIYIDPARRDTKGKKTVLIEDCTPNILDIENLLEEKAEITMIKLSPMLDISLAVKSMKNVAEIHIISYNNECKELLFIKKQCNTEPEYHCVHILNDRIEKFTFTKKQEEQTEIVYTDQPEKYLYEPNPSILKAGAYKSIAAKYNLKKLHPSSHLYTSKEFYPDFQGRKFKVENTCSLNKKELKQYLPDTYKANITTRNFPASVDEIRKKTGLKDGGDTYIFATTLSDEKKILIICSKA